MAEQQLGQAERARQTLAEVSALIPADLQALVGSVPGPTLPVDQSQISHDWLIPEILRREATGLLEAQPGR